MVNINDSTAKTEYRIERLDRQRLHDLAQLHAAVYGSRPRKDYFFKKYDTAYTGVQYLGYLAYNVHNHPVAYYGVMPCFIQDAGKIVLAAQSGDTMTHPDYRYKGLFVALATHTFDLCRLNGVRLVFGFPNQNSLHGLVNKLGWTAVGNLERFMIPVKPVPVIRFLARVPLLKHLMKPYARWVMRKYLLPEEGLVHSAAREGFGGVLRNDQYLHYKTYDPSYVLKMGEEKAWVSIKNGLSIGDLHCSSTGFDNVISELKKISSKLGLSQLSFQVSPGTTLHGFFAKKYTPVISFPVTFKDLGYGAPMGSIKFTFADIDIF